MTSLKKSFYTLYVAAIIFLLAFALPVTRKCIIGPDVAGFSFCKPCHVQGSKMFKGWYSVLILRWLQ
jgi:hypothetical protein